jgi:hypothetical protein
MTPRRGVVSGVAGAGALVVWSAVALAQAQPRDLCRSNETKAECHARLECGEDEELEDCQERVRKSKGGGGDDDGGGGGDDRDDRGRDDRGRDDRGRDDRGRDDDGGGGDDDDWRDDRGGGGDDDDGGDSGEWRRRRSGGGGGGGRGDGGGGSTYSGVKTFGLGLEIGEPTGLNGKYFLSETGALDFGVGYIYEHYYYDDGLHLYADYLWHPAVLTSTDSLMIPFYVGVGLRYWDFEYCDRDFCYDGSAIGIRVPLGISFDFNNAPLDVFIQLVPVLDFLQDDYRERYDDDTHLGIDVSAGIRYWFN